MSAGRIQAAAQRLAPAGRPRLLSLSPLADGKAPRGFCFVQPPTVIKPCFNSLNFTRFGLLMHRFAVVGALFGLFAVLLGAFGAHGLEARVGPDRLAIWATASHYLGWHATTLLVLGLAGAALAARRLALVAAWCLSTGSFIFSGSLYLLVLSDQRLWGAVTPVGGVLLALGWGLLAVAAVIGGANQYPNQH
jgi:uncharacterized membrane protein YgdD (TMEM256/DUF423 family)